MERAWWNPPSLHSACVHRPCLHPSEFARIFGAPVGPLVCCGPSRHEQIAASQIRAAECEQSRRSAGPVTDGCIFHTVFNGITVISRYYFGIY